MYGPVPCQLSDRLARRLDAKFRVIEHADLADREGAKAAVAQADAVVAINFESDLAAAATKLKMIHVPGAGIDAFKREAIPKGCVLCNCYEHEGPIAEYVMLNILLHETRQNHYAALMQQGKRDGSGRHNGAFHGEAAGKTIGLIGFGHIGEAVASRAAAMGMRTIAVKRTPVEHDLLDWCKDLLALPTLLQEADYVVIACSLNDSTRGMLGEKELRLLKPAAYLINPARAEIIDEAALYRALAEKWFAGAALDAQYQYPPDARTTMHGSKLPFHKLDNVTLTPHFSAWTEPMIERRFDRVAENLKRLARGADLLRVVMRG
jgi:phosphoglycerate dehydrogenase-like enzyme